MQCIENEYCANNYYNLRSNIVDDLSKKHISLNYFLWNASACVDLFFMCHLFIATN